MTNTNATPALEYCLALAPRSDRWEAEAELRALMAERDRLRAALVQAREAIDTAHMRALPVAPDFGDYYARHLRDADAALANREGVKP